MSSFREMAWKWPSPIPTYASFFGFWIDLRLTIPFLHFLVLQLVEAGYSFGPEGTNASSLHLDITRGVVIDVEGKPVNVAVLTSPNYLLGQSNTAGKGPLLAAMHLSLYANQTEMVVFLRRYKGCYKAATGECYYM